MATSLFTQDVGCKSKLIGAYATITFVVAVVFANCEMYLSPMLVSFFAISLVPLQSITTSFFVMFSVCRLRESVIPFVLALGFVIPITLYELPKRSASLSAHPQIWLSPRKMTLCCLLLFGLCKCDSLRCVWAGCSVSSCRVHNGAKLFFPRGMCGVICFKYLVVFFGSLAL